MVIRFGFGFGFAHFSYKAFDVGFVILMGFLT